MLGKIIVNLPGCLLFQEKTPRSILKSFLFATPLLMFVVVAFGLASTTSFPAPDELEHISYAAYLQATGRVLPEFQKQTTLDRSDFGQWDTRPNYIGHPSPYYLFIEQFLDRSLAPQQAILLPRLASLGLLLVGLALAVQAGFRSFEQDEVALAVFCIGLVFCPEILSIARQVTNDALGILGGALAYWGAMTQQRFGWFSSVGIVAGLTLALWAKLNAGLEVGVFLSMLFALRRPCSAQFLASIAAGGLIGVLPYIIFIIDYGAVVPVTAEAIWEVSHLNNLLEYFPIFFFNIGYTWGFGKTDLWSTFTTTGVLTTVAFWTMMAGAVLGVWPARQHSSDPRATVAVAAVMTFLLVLPMHLWFASTRLGYSIPAASFRYYLPLWPALIHALAYAVLTAAKPSRRVSLAFLSAAALGLGWI